MSFFDRIAACNRHDPARFVPFRISGRRLGWIHRDLLPALAAYDDVLDIDHSGVGIRAGIALSPAVARIAADLRERGYIPAWRDELYPVATAFHEPPMMEIERAAAPLFGVTTYGIHVTGYVNDGSGFKLWVPRRGDVAIEPGKLDSTVAGGQPSGLSLTENLVKECDEEASIPRALALTARPVGCVSYRLEVPNGLKPDILFCYDLALPPDFVPQNRDGEVGDYRLRPVDEVMAMVRDTTEFKFNVNLVLIDFFVRHGLLTPETPGYPEIVRSLRS